MSSPFVYITENPEETKRLLGIDDEGLQELIQQAELRHQDLQAKREQSETRLIAKGSGRKPSLSIPEQIVLTLTYLRQHPTFQMLGIMFNVSESTAHNIFHYWLDILQSLLPESLFSQLQNSESDWAVAKDILSQQELIIDSSVQDRERPTDNQEQAKYYSGHKKTRI